MLFDRDEVWWLNLAVGVAEAGEVVHTRVLLHRDASILTRIEILEPLLLRGSSMGGGGM